MLLLSMSFFQYVDIDVVDSRWFKSSSNRIKWSIKLNTGRYFSFVSMEGFAQEDICNFSEVECSFRSQLSQQLEAYTLAF